ncbi:MAG: hypothetical protein QF890_02365, partial [Myxococcota bacterium]|nr:hypothetical protein [Myxococcota bacterium]MDP7431399.1 hypothetical protein [Myxococcota bacterium]HJO23805.1 hypothetical protein [Myxococcota bacterium]
TFRSMQIAVMDVTSTKDEHGNSRAPQFAAQLRQLDSELYKPAWIASPILRVRGRRRAQQRR